MMKKVMVFCSLMFFINSANAQIPIADYEGIAKLILENMKEMMRDAEYVKIVKSKFDNVGVISEMKIDNDNNVYANWIVRKNQAKADVNNLEVLAKSTPALNSCGSMIASFEDPCEIASRRSELSADDNSYVLKKSDKAKFKTKTKTRSIEELQQGIIDRAFVEEKSAANANANANANAKEIGVNDPTNPYFLLTTEGAALTLSPEQKQAMIDYIDLVSPPFVDGDDKMNMNDVDPRYPLNEMIEKSFSGLPRTVLQGLLAKRVAGPSGFSEMTALESFKNEYFGGDGTVDGSVAQKIATSELAIPEAIYRNLAIMRTFQVHMSLLKFRASLDREAMLANKLANKLK